MAVLYKAVQMSNELKKQAIIQDLLAIGITEHKGKSIYDWDYYTVRHLLVMARLKRED